MSANAAKVSTLVVVRHTAIFHVQMETTTLICGGKNTVIIGINKALIVYMPAFLWVLTFDISTDWLQNAKVCATSCVHYTGLEH